MNMLIMASHVSFLLKVQVQIFQHLLSADDLVIYFIDAVCRYDAAHA